MRHGWFRTLFSRITETAAKQSLYHLLTGPNRRMGKTMRVLIVEDNAALSLFLRKGLELEGHTAVCVHNGDEALAAAHRDQPDLIILDLNLPRRDGFEVLQDLKAESFSSSVLVLTGRGSVEDRISCLDMGADDYLLKPFSFYEMLARCRAISRRQAGSTSSTVRHGDLQVDRMTRTVLKAGQEVELTGKEFALLDYLLQHRGRTVSRPELLSNVWKMSPDAGTNVVDVYVNYLRRKLQIGESVADVIETVRGAGYRIKPLLEAVPVHLKKPAASALQVYAGGSAYAGAA